MSFENDYPELSFIIFTDNRYGGYVGRFFNIPNWCYHDLKGVKLRGTVLSDVFWKASKILEEYDIEY